MIRTWWAVAAVMAILAMHGLATHASSHAPSSAVVADAGHAGHSGHSGHAGQDHPASGTTTLPVAAVAHGEPGHETTVLSLCLAVLATAAVLLLRAVRPRAGLLAILPPAAATSTAPVVVRLHAPPDLHALSVLRC